MFNKSIRSVVIFATLGMASFSVFALNPNTASVDELADQLNGIGPKLAEKIVRYREENGNFKTLEEMTKVNGIGESFIEKNKSQIEFD